MTTLMEIEAAAASLSPADQKLLLRFLSKRTGGENTEPSHSVLDLPPLQLGRILRPFDPDDDLLGEMIEGRM